MVGENYIPGITWQVLLAGASESFTALWNISTPEHCSILVPLHSRNDPGPVLGPSDAAAPARASAGKARAPCQAGKCASSKLPAQHGRLAFPCPPARDGHKTSRFQNLSACMSPGSGIFLVLSHLGIATAEHLSPDSGCCSLPWGA